MRNIAVNQDPAVEALETREWQDSLDYVLQQGGGVARLAGGAGFGLNRRPSLGYCWCVMFRENRFRLPPWRQGSPYRPRVASVPGLLSPLPASPRAVEPRAGRSAIGGRARRQRRAVGRRAAAVLVLAVVGAVLMLVGIEVATPDGSGYAQPLDN